MLEIHKKGEFTNETLILEEGSLLYIDIQEGHTHVSRALNGSGGVYLYICAAVVRKEVFCGGGEGHPPDPNIIHLKRFHRPNHVNSISSSGCGSKGNLNPHD